MHRQSPQVVLASASPRRRELLEQIGVSYRVQLSPVDETPADGENAADYVRRIALEKARSGAGASRKDEVVLGADTAVVLDGLLLGKPASREAALTMLSHLSGRTHQVLTAVALVCGQKEAVRLSESRVTFREMTETEREWYVETGEPMDKAGAYAIQGRAALFIGSLNGSYSGVMGLPLFETGCLLREFGIRMPA